MTTSEIVSELEQHKAQLIAYCRAKVNVGDWRATAQTAMDLCELDAKLTILGLAVMKEAQHES